MGLFDSLLGLLGGVGGALGGLGLFGGLGNYSPMDSLTGMPPGYWNQFAKSLGMDDEEIKALMSDMNTGTLNATTRLNNQRREERNKLMSELSARPKPGKLCNPICWIDDGRCQECLAQQNRCQEAFVELQKMENAASNPAAVSANAGKMPTRCALCGAPFVKGASECPYCGTAYPAGAFSAGASYGSADAAKAAAHTQAQRVCVMYADIVANNARQLAASGKYSTLLKFTPNAIQELRCKFAMSADQVKQGADQYGVSRSAYIAGVINGTYTSVSETAYKEWKEQEQRQREEQQRRREEQQQREREASNARFEQQLNAINHNVPKYSGGPQSVGYCCGNCIHYMSHSNECAYSAYNHPKNASDYCVDHHSR